ncbi:hypothetical protein [Paraburkholderia sp. DHOC27]|uniref:hypothetical protein n=1 Tax=Paraburkholderia sp. DHOC27 TaxID=2303330 RepID=UPI0015F32EDF|nr:hypothetical protein [Paraburkholderia sp. DHOC27]
MAAEQSAAIFLQPWRVVARRGVPSSMPGVTRGAALSAQTSRSGQHATVPPMQRLVAALLPVAVHLDLVANRVMVVMIVSESRGHHANGNGGKCQRKQNLLHGMGGSNDLVD